MKERSISWDQFIDLEEDREIVFYPISVNNQNIKNLQSDNKINNSYEPYTYWGDIIAKTAFTGWLVYVLFIV